MDNQQLPSVTSPERPFALRDEWVERIFTRLSTLYGSKFADLWRGTDADEVKRTWAEKLAGFYAMPGCIKAALDACDERPWPPTLPEFLMLCREEARRLGPKLQALPPPQVDSDEVQRRANELAGRFSGTSAPSRDWAVDIKNRYFAGERLYPMQIQKASEALGETWGKDAAV